jgi:predicted ATPase
MFKEITIENFKPFGSEQQARLAPITLIYGPNSAGKSSLIQSLLMLKQSIEGRSPNSLSALVTQGEYVNLGTFRSLLHKHDIERELKIGVKIDNIPRRFDAEVLGIDTFFFHDRNESCYLSRARYQREFEGSECPVLLEKVEHGSRAGEEHAPASFRIHPGDESLENAIRWGESGGAAATEAKKELREAFQNAAYFQDFFLPYILRDLDPANRSQGVHQFLNIFGFIPRYYYKSFNDLKYLGPLRMQPSRQYMMGETSSVGIRGENSPHIIYHGGERTTSAINKWFKQFEMPYELEVRSIGDPETTGGIITLTLTDTRTQTRVATTDVGFGVGQLMPILVEGLISREKVICVEQPEIHLHPRLQAHLGDFFIDTATEKNRANQWILETHSETLMLRLQRRIRQGKLKPEDVSVLYVQPVEDEGSIIMELELDEQGHFLDEWPDGFFEEGYRELYGESE